MRTFKLKRGYSALAVYLSLVILFAMFIHVWKPFLISYLFSYTRLIIQEISYDRQRSFQNNFVLAQKEWRFYKLESRFGQQWCKEKGEPREDFAWLTVVVNDAYVIPALVLGYSIRTFSCYNTMIAFVAGDVSSGARRALRKLGWDTHEVESMDCNWMDRKKRRRPSNRGIRGTHTRFHAWSYTQYSKIIYVDADIMLMSSVDELFGIDADFAAAPCARPGILDPCFNAGLIVFRPNIREYEAILERWWEISDDHCPNDQVLLWHHFAVNGRWIALPYAYNVRRLIFRPLKVFHFACCPPPKPWLSECRASRTEAKNYDQPIMQVDDMVILFWKMFYKLLKKFDLDKWWRTTKFFRSSQEFANTSYAECKELVQI